MGSIEYCVSEPMTAVPGSRYALPSARRRRRVDELGVDRLEAVGPGQLLEVDRLLGRLFLLRPAAETAEVVVIELIERERARVGVPLLARRLLAQVELGLGVGGDRREILLRQVA